MKRLIAVLLLLSLVIPLKPVLAAKEQKGASPQAYEHASDQAVFNRISDWFATRGKSEEERAKILEERKAKRAAKRAQKEAEKAKREAIREAEKEKIKAQRRIRRTEKKSKQQGKRFKEKFGKD